MRNELNIQALIGKYDEGLTTKHEEEWLRQTFRKMKEEEVPEQWRAYKAIFAYVDRQKAPAAVVNHRGRNIRLWSGIVAAAACIALLLTLHHGNETTTNYAIIDGVRTEDPDIVRQEALDALSQVSQGEDNCFEALKSINLGEEKQKD